MLIKLNEIIVTQEELNEIVRNKGFKNEVGMYTSIVECNGEYKLRLYKKGE